MVHKNKKGFTLIELILVVALMVVLVTLAAPFYQSLQLKADLGQVREELANNLRRQEFYAADSRLDSAWGVKFNFDSYTLFKGDGFVGRDPALDEIISLPKNVSLSATLAEVVFIKASGNTATAGSLTLANLINNQNLTISISNQGLVEMN